MSVLRKGMPRMGLQSRFIAAILVLLGAVVAVLMLLWEGQQATQHEVREVTRAAMHELISEQVRMDGEAEVRQLSDALANPLYYFDLDAIGALARAALREADVDYVLVYDPQGRILHDGSGDIAAYGRPMGDALAAEVVAAAGPHARTVGQVNTQPGPAASTCRICHHVQDDHVLVLVLTHPVPMGLMYCPSTGCSCGSTWRAGPSLSTRHEIEETRRLVRDALVADGVPVPDFLR